MSMTKLKTIDVKGKKFNVSVSDEGKFFAEYEREQVSAESLEKLTNKLQSRIARSKTVAIRFVYWKYDSWDEKPGVVRAGTIVGIHGSNDSILVKWDDDRSSEQLGAGRKFFEPGKEKELKRLANALNTAQKAFDDFTDKNTFDARVKVKEALGEIPDADE